MTLPVQISFKKEGEFGCYQCDECPFQKVGDYYDRYCYLFNIKKYNEDVCEPCYIFIRKSLKKMNGED